MGGGLGALWEAGGGHRGLSEPPAALSSRGTLVLEAALRSALMALEQALAEQQKQRGACGLCAPCLFPPCANITQRCPRESHLTPPQPYPIPYRSYPGNIPHSRPPIGFTRTLPCLLKTLLKHCPVTLPKQIPILLRSCPN